MISNDSCVSQIDVCSEYPGLQLDQHYLLVLSSKGSSVNF